MEKRMVCILISFMTFFSIVPLLMLSMVKLLPEDYGDMSYLLFSDVDYKKKQSGVACDEKKCTETKLFQDWHSLAHIEEEFLQKVNTSKEIHDEEESPALLSVDATGQLSSDTAEQEAVEGPAQHPSSNESLGERPAVTEAVPKMQAPNSTSERSTDKEFYIETKTNGSMSTSQRSTIESPHMSRKKSHAELRWVVRNYAAYHGRFMGKRAPEEPHIISEADLHGSHWMGRIPKVACIMGLPSTPQAYAQLKHAVNYFRQQAYEGERQLLIVYHFQDQEARTRIRRLSRGDFIKGVPARTMEVPSSTAMRFGAWAADEDVDIVARWDVNDWHHPQQLKNQVRALVLSGRQACLLKRWTMAPAGGDRTVVDGEIGVEHTLMGQRRWMEDHWEPFLPNNLGVRVLQARQASLALLDMPELVVHHTDTQDEEVDHPLRPGEQLHAYVAIQHAETESE